MLSAKVGWGEGRGHRKTLEFPSIGMGIKYVLLAVAAANRNNSTHSVYYAAAPLDEPTFHQTSASALANFAHDSLSRTRIYHRHYAAFFSFFDFKSVAFTSIPDFSPPLSAGKYITHGIQLSIPPQSTSYLAWLHINHPVYYNNNNNLSNYDNITVTRKPRILCRFFIFSY